MTCLEALVPSETKKNLDGIIKIAKSKNIKVIIAGMIAPTSYGFGYKKSLIKFTLIYQKNISYNSFHFYLKV